MIFYDFEVFEKDWLAVFIDVTKKKEHVIINSPDDTRKAMKKKQVAAAKAGRKAEAKQWKKAQLPYKKMLNALSGAMKDETNSRICGAYQGGYDAGVWRAWT